MKKIEALVKRFESLESTEQKEIIGGFFSNGKNPMCAINVICFQRGKDSKKPLPNKYFNWYCWI